MIRGLALLSNLLQQADSAAASELLKDIVPLLGNLLLKSSVATQEACLSAALKIVHRYLPHSNMFCCTNL